MYRVVFILCLSFISCANHKSRTNSRQHEVSGIQIPEYDDYGSPVISDSIVKENARRFMEEPIITYGGFKTPPACIRKMIARFTAVNVTNPPRKIFLYDYKGRIVFYVPAVCCDYYSDLYDMDCNLIGHPDGGITGKGDGSFADFFEVRSGEVLIWADERKK